ncbi:MAG: FKBP-type peptidyl-prolyl cis-trans isomerase [Bacteriovoracaceae bacterium]
MSILKRSLLIVALASLGSLVACKPQSGGNVKLENDDEKTFYAMGHTTGKRIERVEPTEAELNAFAQGLKDGAKGTEPKIQVSKFQSKIGQMFRSRMMKSVNVEKEKGKKFLETFVTKEGGKKTASGLAYKILDEGKGPKPKETDTVKVKYKGTLIDGTEFDANDAATFPLNRVIKGWTEGMQLVGAGGKVKLVIPAELGYGDVGAGAKIPGGATLVFDVELIEIQAPKKADKKK